MADRHSQQRRRWSSVRLSSGRGGVAVAVLISGSGSNLQALIDAANRDEIQATICVVISNQSDAYGLERARTAGIPVACLPHKDYADRADYDAALLALVNQYAPDIVVLAGFMRILTPHFVQQFAGRMLNIHPSLLPRYVGLHTHQRAIDAGDRFHGCTVHFVTAELDGGPAIIQGRLPIQKNDDARALAERVLKLEHCILPKAVALLASGRLQLCDGDAWMDGERLQVPLPADTTL